MLYLKTTTKNVDRKFSLQLLFLYNYFTKAVISENKNVAEVKSKSVSNFLFINFKILVEQF